MALEVASTTGFETWLFVSCAVFTSGMASIKQARPIFPRNVVHYYPGGRRRRRRSSPLVVLWLSSSPVSIGRILCKKSQRGLPCNGARLAMDGGGIGVI